MRYTIATPDMIGINSEPIPNLPPPRFNEIIHCAIQIAKTINRINGLLFFFNNMVKIKPIIVEGCKIAPNIRPSVYAPIYY